MALPAATATMKSHVTSLTASPRRRSLCLLLGGAHRTASAARPGPKPPNLRRRLLLLRPAALTTRLPLLRPTSPPPRLKLPRPARLPTNRSRPPIHLPIRLPAAAMAEEVSSAASGAESKFLLVIYRSINLLGFAKGYLLPPERRCRCMWRSTPRLRHDLRLVY